ncbi:MAG: GDSL-type esterase/lipase family protein [Patescibacteria group bacterium]|nr:hypothetical protein [Patescibacteria group bacterium]
MNRYLQKIISKIKKDKVYKIVFYGDSITSTEWVHPNWREIVEYVLKDYIGSVTKDWTTPSWRIRCINSGMDGATTKDLLKDLNEYVLTYKPDLVLSIFGKNDMYLGIEPKEHKRNIRKIALNIIEKDIDYVFCTSTATLNQKRNIDFLSYKKLTSEALDKLPVKIVDLFEEFKAHDLEKFFTFISENGNDVAGIKPGDIDYLHPNQLGNAYIAKILLKEVWGIEFDPELYIKETLAGVMYPEYFHS